MLRREFIAILGGMFAWPVAARAQVAAHARAAAGDDSGLFGKILHGDR
jgi:hypothetical protein